MRASSGSSRTRVQELPAQLLESLEEQVLDDDVGSERLDLVHVEERQRGGDPVALLFEQLLHQVEDLLRVIDDEDVRLTTVSGHSGAFRVRGHPGPNRSGIGRSRSPKGGHNEGGVPRGCGIRHGKVRVLGSA